MSIKRVISPFTYYHEANRKIQTEESYPESDNPGLYMWNLKYQQLNKFPIPKAFIDRHNLHPTTRYLFENSKIE
jgi:hypothetical protein